MKKTGLLLCTVISLFFLVGSSIWEGAAGVAANGELPESGLYIATNSFPLNSVVDVANLETGMTVRVVAAAPLESTPGLLAVLSRDAAEAIGLPARSLGRVRMSQPPDAVAFSRFARRAPPAGDPDFDPAAFVALDGAASERGAAAEGGMALADDDLIIYLPEYPPLTGMAAREPEPVAEPELIAEPEPVAEPELIAEPEPVAEPELIAEPEPVAESELIAEEEPVAEPELVAEEEPVEEPELIAEAQEQDMQDLLAGNEAQQQFHQDALSLMRGFFPEHEIIDDIFAPAQDEPELFQEPELIAEPGLLDQVQAAEPDIAGGYILSLVPTGARPPGGDAAVAPDPAYIIPGIGPAPPREHHIDPSLVIDPIRPAPPAPAAPLVMEPLIPPVAAPPAAVAAPPAFTAPIVSSLQAGKFYLQIAAYNNPEAVRYELARINRIDSSLSREVVVIRGVNPDHGTVYQILIGPLNLGESGALLQRFRSTTHRDAFIRAGS